jgi:DNA recombination protein RmuC
LAARSAPGCGLARPTTRRFTAGMDVLIALLSAFVGGAVIWFWVRRSNKSALQPASSQDATLGLLQQTQSENAKLQNRINELTADKARLETLLETEKPRLAEQEQRTKQYLADIEKMRTTLQTEFQAVAAKLLDEKSAKFTEQNKTQLDALLSPLKQQLIDFRTRVDVVYKTEGDDRTALKAQIEQLRQLNVHITDEAHSLTQALKGQAQVRGAWGELVLDRLLEGCGLRRGEDYFVQESLPDPEGRRSRPDIIIRLPDQRHLVIDSKVSLVDYEQAANATEPAQREIARKAHAGAVKKRIQELADKKYEDSGKLFSPEYVFMFIPIEPAFAMALEVEASLYDWAFDRKVILVTSSGLLAALRTVATIWKQDRQTKNVQEIAKRGGLLYDKFAGLYVELEAVGGHLSKARESYDDVLGKLKTGRGNLLSQVEELKTLGAKAQKSLPTADSVED